MKQFFTLVLCALTFVCIGQGTTVEQEIDPRLYETFDAAYLEGLHEKNSFLLTYFTLYLDKGWRIQDFPEGKISNFDMIDFDSEDLLEINIYKLIKKYGLHRSKQANSYYRIGSSSKVLIILSEDQFAEIFNTATGRS